MDDTYITPPPVSSSVECSEPHTPPRGVTVITEPPTPTVPNNATGQNYASDHVRREEIYQILSKEISGKVVGPMPPTEFVKEFLSESSDAPEYDRTELTAMISAPTEVAMYKPFIDAFNTCCPQLLISDTHSNKFPTYEDREISPDITVYETATQFAVSSTQSTNRPIDEVAFMVEFKHDHADDPFRDHIPGFENTSDRSEKTLGQICAYATAHMAAQFRTHVFSLLVFPKYARILRWDRAGVIVTGKIDLVENASLLGEFLWRYQNATPAQRGHDQNVTPVALETVVKDIPDGVEKLGATNDSSFFSVKFPNNDEYFISKAVYMGVGSPTGRSTRTFKALSVKTKSVVFLKDTWRVIHPGILPEHEIYKMLDSQGIPHVATLITSHDMKEQVTRTKDFSRKEWVKFEGPELFRTFQHYRLVLGEVARPLQTFRNVRELIQVFRDALHAHRLAHDMANILHRDISAGNIMITEKGRGLLVDWDLSKSLGNGSGASSPPERTGTWQFMAARLIVDRKAGTPPPIPNREDDLESFWHVLLWVALQNCDHQMVPRKIVERLGSLFDYMYIGGTGQMEGGDAKRDSLETRSCIKAMNLRSNILHEILEDTAEPLATRYSSDKDLNDILEVQRMWEKVESENPTLDEDHRIIELVLRIAQTRKKLLARAHPSWMKWRTMQDGAEWMEKIFENALNDPTVDWNTGSGNIQRTLPRPSASRATKRKSDSNIDERKVKKLSNLETLPE